MIKNILSVFTVFIVAVTIAGCGKDTSTEPTSSNKKEIIRMTYVAGELDATSSDLDVVFENFYKKHPNCEIVVEEGGTALMAKIAANDAPDIIRVKSIDQLPTYVNKNIIMPLDDLLAKSELFDENDIYPLCIDCFRFDGKEFGKGYIYGLPKDWGTSAMWVNKSMLEEAGLEIPTMEKPLTYEKMAEYAKKLTKKEGNEIKVFGLADISTPDRVVETILNLKGKSMWSEDFKKVNMDDPDVRAAFKYVYDLKVNGYTNSPLYPMEGNGNPEFARGKAAMNMFGLYSGSVYERNDKERTVDYKDMILCPSPILEENGKLIVTAAPVGAVISASTKNIDLVFDCWEFIHLGELAEKRAAKGFNLPVKKSIAENVNIASEFQKKNYEFARKLAECDYMFVKVNPYVSNTSIAGVMEKYFTPLLFGQYTFDEAMDLIGKEIQLLIDEGVAN